MFATARTQNSSWCASNCEERVFDPPQTQTCSLQRGQYLDSNQHHILFPFPAQCAYLLSHIFFCPPRKFAVTYVQQTRGAEQCPQAMPGSQGPSQGLGCYGAATPVPGICSWLIFFITTELGQGCCWSRLLCFALHFLNEHLLPCKWAKKRPPCLRDGEIGENSQIAVWNWDL